MEDLKSFISAITKNKVKQIDVIGNTNKSHSQVQSLYEGMVKGDINSDEDIAATFFSRNENAPFYSSRLKKKLKNRLINTLFFVDVNQQNFNEHNRAYFTCYKQVAAVKILLGLNARQAAIPVAEEAFKLALEFEFVELIISLARDLQLHYVTITGERKKIEKINKILEQYTEVLHAEIQAEKYYTDIISYYVGSKATKPEIKLKAEKYSEKIKELAKVVSPRFNFYGYLVHTLRYEVANDYLNTLKVSEEALNYFEPIANKVSISNIFMFAIKILISQVYIGDFKEAGKAAEKCFKFSREGTFNWFLTCDYASISSFHSKNFQGAYQFYSKAANHANFEKQPPSMRERWYILEAYIYFFLFTKKLKIKEENSFKKFRLSRFLNDVPVFSKDKRGANISILVLQILFLLQQKKFGEIIDRTESLKTYSQRYLKQDDTYRSNCFIHMLLTLPDCSFHKKAVLRKSEKYCNKLLEVPMSAANQNAEIEIVPYEMLWEFVLESLDEKWHH